MNCLKLVECALDINMVFRVNNLSYNLTELMRKLGYVVRSQTPKGELDCVRRLQGDYPRFHAYVTANDKVISFSLHLDQKKPSYGQETAHSGDYDSDTVREEMERMKELIYRER